MFCWTFACSQNMITQELLFKVLRTLATIGALTMPLTLVLAWLDFSDFIEGSGVFSFLLNLMRVLSIPGLLFILVMLWRSDETSNEKQYYTILSVLFLCIPLSIYWFSKGINSEWKMDEKKK
jgi:L-asparagine transporter-like permease